MIRRRSSPRSLRADRRGATIVEFALVAPIFVMVLFALFDLGYRMYLQSVVEGTLHRAARLASIGQTGTSAVDSYVRSQLQAFSSTSIAIDKKSYFEFSGVAKAEADDNGNGICEPGESYIDENGNGKYDDGKTSGSTGLGGSDDIVFYTVTVTFNRLFPLSKFLGLSNTESVAANTVLRNQPYGAQAGLPAKTPCP